MSDKPAHAQTIPRPILIAAGAMVCLAITLAGFGQVSNIGRSSVPKAEAVMSKEFWFAERGDGKMVVHDENGLAAMDPANAGFLLGVVRGLGRERTLQGADPDAPYTLTRWSDGRLSLLDRETGHEIQISAFGADNIHTFASLLTSEDARK